MLLIEKLYTQSVDMLRPVSRSLLRPSTNRTRKREKRVESIAANVEHSAVFPSKVANDTQEIVEDPSFMLKKRINDTLPPKKTTKVLNSFKKEDFLFLFFADFFFIFLYHAFSLLLVPNDTRSASKVQ